MVGLNRGTDGFIQPTGSVFFLSHISLDVSHSVGCFSPAVENRTRRSYPRRKLVWCSAKEDGIGELEDGEDETRQGGTLSQRGVRKRVERVMLTSGLCLPISSHYFFIPPPVCTSHPHFPFCFLCCTTYCHFCSRASQAWVETQSKPHKRKGMVITLTLNRDLIFNSWDLC